ncbi:hypothetical protein BU26DRAFT_408147, partial [Trematosphaeria pertusa]
IDCALLLWLERHPAVRIADFVGGFDWPRTFNQSMHGARSMKTKVDIRRRAEGKARLGIWLAVWYGSAARFAPLSFGGARTPMRLPFLPVLLVVCGN